MSTRNPWSAIVYDHLLGTRLLSEPIRNAHEEQQLTALRRRCLEGGRSTPTLLAHLAIQCFLNEYAWWEGEDETSELTHLPMDSKGLLLRACYRGLADLPGAAELLRTDWPAPLRAVLKTQIADVLSEGQFSASVPALTPIRGGVSEVVREMYEANPYPRWALIGSPKSEPAGAVADILVAGCGTGKHSIHTALRYPGARVLAVDLSRASLGYAMRLTAQAGIANIEYAQADLLELPSLGRTFDLVESFGTLPCMEDPAEGLAALTRLMRPGGKIRLGLYSEAARRPLVRAQALGRAYP
ncbi:bifunctional 2-polyprenyl-6-hydroxyphenol methylase/3-demethylubiquinol 3-O-methyltransferase UbiG, partial [uncultured Phenylobacterium sp.]|uniref:class I SAM-dependent methyltransferase n=1 Tax=uncultured Phenylobacterium sp. TaxID=349273 RepID=UPI0025F0DA47